MWQHLKAVILFAILIILIPLISIEINIPQEINSTPNPTKKSVAELDNPQEIQDIPANHPMPAPIVEETSSFLILDESTGKTMTVSIADYVRGSLAAEMPPTFHTEAMKAQAIAAHTYALCVQKMQQNAPDPALKGADFKANPSDWKVYTTEEIFRERYGDMADAYWKSITDAADAVTDYVLLYDGQPIVAAYHSMSNGMTEDAGNVWTGSVPYLMPVESRGDILAPDYETTVYFTSEELGAAIKKTYPEIKLGDDPAGWLKEGERSSSGYVLEVLAGDGVIPAAQLRTLLDLRSTDFDIAFTSGQFAFTVRGYGHGVGFSQYGADYLGRQGMDFEEILAHYYSGATLGATVRPKSK